MGSYYGTCGVTNLPIEGGDEVVLFVLENALVKTLPESSGMCHSDTLYYPVSPPIRAVHDDCGIFVPKEGDGEKNAEIFLNHLQEVAPKLGKISWEDFDELVLREDAKIPGLENSSKGLLRVEKQLYLFPVLSSVYEKMTRYAFENEDFKRRVNFRFQNAKRDSGFTRKSIRKQFGEDWDAENREMAKHCARLFMKSEVPNMTGFPWHKIAEECFIAKGEETTLEDVPLTAREFIAFRYAMDDMRKSFAPLNGGGSQTLAYELHKDIADFVSKRAEKRMDPEYESGDDDEVAPSTSHRMP